MTDNGTHWVLVFGDYSLKWSVFTTNQNAIKNKGYLYDNSAAVHTLTLPGAPSTGEIVAYKDYKESFNRFPLTIGRNGKNIRGLAADAVINDAGGWGFLVYTDATIGWVFINSSFNPISVIPAGTIVEGKCLGLEYARTGANQVTVQPGICFDANNNPGLILSAAQAVTIPGTSNGVFNLFLCNDGVVRQDTSVTGANLSAYARAWIGYAPNTGTVLKSFHFIGGNVNEIWFDLFSENPFNSLTVPPAGISTAIDISSFMPVSRVSGILLGGQVGQVGTVFLIASGVSGVNQTSFTVAGDFSGAGDINEWEFYANAPARFIPIFGNNIFWGRGSQAAGYASKIGPHVVRIRR